MSTIPFKSGRVGSVLLFGALILLLHPPKITAQSARSLTLNDQPLHYCLPEGETTLVISVPDPALLARFTFINEETVRGALQIAVSNSPLSPTDPSWNRVSGDIAFAHKRHSQHAAFCSTHVGAVCCFYLCGLDIQ